MTQKSKLSIIFQSSSRIIGIINNTGGIFMTMFQTVFKRHKLTYLVIKGEK